MKNFNFKENPHVLIYACLIMLIFILSGILYFNNTKRITSKAEQEFINLKKSYKKFKNLSGIDFHVAWHKAYGNFQYQLNGNPIYKKTDCSISIFQFLISQGAKLKTENAGKIKEILIQKSEKRKNAKEVEVGDILIFWKTGKVGHCGCAYKRTGNRIYYCDVNSKDNGAGYKWIYFNQLEGVYDVSFAFWCGDVLQNIIK